MKMQTQLLDDLRFCQVNRKMTKGQRLIWFGFGTCGCMCVFVHESVLVLVRDAQHASSCVFVFVPCFFLDACSKSR